MTLATAEVKICGLTTDDAITAVNQAGADYAGFVFFPASPRNVTPLQAATLSSRLNSTIRTVAVVVDATDTALEEIITHLAPNYIQLHGSETPERVADIRQRFCTPVIKAIKVKNSDDIARAQQFKTCADMLLFDAKAPETGSGHLPGGNGLAFDWVLLAGRQFGIPWFLSGGLNAENVEDAVKISGAMLVDASSSVESSPGVKSPELIHEFIRRTKHIS